MTFLWGILYMRQRAKMTNSPRTLVTMVCPEGDILLKGSNGTIRSCHVTADRAPRDADTELKGKQDGIPQQMVGIQLGRSPKLVALFSEKKKKKSRAVCFEFAPEYFTQYDALNLPILMSIVMWWD